MGTDERVAPPAGAIVTPMGRGSGVVVLVAALVVLAVPALRTTRIDGAARTIDIPRPPAVGDCVTEAWTMTWSDYDPARSLFDNYAQMPLEPCAGERFGEVVAVLDDPQRPGPADSSAGSGFTDLNLTLCGTAVSTYLGATPARISAGVAWSPSVLSWWPMVSSPSDLQLAAGQRWLACIVGPGPAGGSEKAYEGTLRNSVTTGVARDRSGLCNDDPGLSDGYSGDACSRPHTTQLLAQAPTPGTATPMVRLRDSCAAAAAALTGLADPTAGGALTVVVVVDDLSGRTTADPVAPHGSLQCALTSTDPSRTLSGGLMGLGDDPIPWA